MLRMVSAGSLIINDQVRFISTDPWFVMRQIEQVIANFPHYAWFDPMTAYPGGKTIDWGPLFPVSVAAVCLLFGVTTRPEAAFIASLVPVVLGAVMVPVMYLTGRLLKDWRTGLISAGLIAVVAGEYMYRSFFGYVDHHILEVLLSTVFILIYLAVLRYPGSKEISSKDLHSIRAPLLLSLLAGVVYFLGLLNMPTMVFFALIIGIFTVAQGVADYMQGRSIAYLLFINTSVFTVVIIWFLLFGVKQNALSFTAYSMAHVYAYLMIIAASAVLYGLSVTFRTKKILFIASLLGTGLFAIFLLVFALPGLGQMIVDAGEVFISNPYSIDELQPWNLYRAAGVFNAGLILMAAGYFVVLYGIARTRRAESMFVLVWGVVMLVATIQHQRYEYYLVVPLVLLSALAVEAAWTLGGGDLLKLVRRAKDKEAPIKTRKDRKLAKRQDTSRARAALTIVALVLLAIFAGLSAFTSYKVASYPAFDRIPDDWFQSMEWMRYNTPDTGVNYSRIYEHGEFHYPNSSYGVLARWPAGHWITYIAERIPNANPFQDHITGPNNIYDFFSSEDEDNALAVAKALGSRYVVTDFGFAISKSASGSTLNDTQQLDYYTPSMIEPLDSGGTRVLMLFSQSYFLGMSSRLHNFDGSMVVPDTAYYVEYTWQNGVAYPVVSKRQLMPASEAREKAANATLSGGLIATALSGFIDQPVDVVPALRHFRIVYESPTNARQSGYPEMKAVKIFEIVEGARIRGEGIIELPLETIQGRQFTYRQQSSNGEFVVPYATGDTGKGVRALGPYRIAGSGVTFEVREEDVLQGRLIN